MTEKTGPTEEDFRKADALAEELRKSLPTEFILGARKAREGEIQYPDLYFVADPEIPGLFRAKVDPNFIMGRTPTPTGIKINNGEPEKPPESKSP